MGYATQGFGGPLLGVSNSTIYPPVVIGNATNNTTFESDGTMVANGDATCYNDIFLAISPRTTGVGSPTLRTFGGNIKKFTMAVNDVCEVDAAEFVHDWAEGTPIEVHVHWATRGTNNTTERGVKWEIDYTWANMQAAGGTIVFGAPLTLSSEGGIAALEPDVTHKYTSVGTFTPTGGKIGANILLSLKRVAAVAAAPVDDPWVLMVGLHYKCDTIGSRTISGK